jgi:hypothetical protein
MSIREFAANLCRSLESASLPSTLRDEKGLEQQVLVPIAARLVKRHPGMLLCVHPYGNKGRCRPSCDAIPPDGAGRVIGCPKCWAASKAWASVATFGTHHDFDIVAKDREGHTLALELKLAKVQNGRMPNSELQRFLGQCILAATKHHVVVGVFGCRGKLNDKWHQDTDLVVSKLGNQNISLVFLNAGQQPG